jgi:alpha-glucosidase (family GH31 glycosyl hydrolase)
MKENEETGIPPLRSLLLEYEDDKTASSIIDQFLLGSNLMMAPIFKEG